MATLDPFAALLEIQSRAVSAAAPLPRATVSRALWRGLGFQLAGVRFVTPVGEATEILTLPRTTTLPGVRPWVLGVANVRGRLLPIHDLHRYLALSPTMPRGEWRVLVVEDGDFLAGLVVEQSLGMQQFAEDSVEDDRPRDMDLLAPYVRGSYRQSGRVWYVLSLLEVVRDARFMQVAADAGVHV